MAETQTVSLETLKTLQGKNAVLMARPLEMDHQIEAQLIPFQTSLSFDPSADSDSTATKDGPVNTRSAVETDAEVEFVNNNSWIADKIRHMLFDGKPIELWIINQDRLRLNADGTTNEAYMWYTQGSVKEDSNDNDADDNSTRDVSFAIDKTPVDGWSKFSKEQQHDFDFVFRGIGVITDDDQTGGGSSFDENKDGANKPAIKDTKPVTEP